MPRSGWFNVYVLPNGRTVQGHIFARQGAVELNAMGIGLKRVYRVRVTPKPGHVADMHEYA